MATGELKTVSRRQGHWGGSYVLEAQDDALIHDGVGPGDHLVVDRSGSAPADDGLVIIEETVDEPGPRRPGAAPRTRRRLLLRKLEHFGAKVRLQPGSSSPRCVPYISPESAGIWGTVVAVMRKFEAA